MACPTCGEGEIVERRSRKGRTFFGCARYPECDFVSWNKPVARPCPGCDATYMVEAGKRGQLKCTACGATAEMVPELAIAG